jgi:hypothetical protein
MLHAVKTEDEADQIGSHEEKNIENSTYSGQRAVPPLVTVLLISYLHHIEDLPSRREMSREQLFQVGQIG